MANLRLLHTKIIRKKSFISTVNLLLRDRVTAPKHRVARVTNLSLQLFNVLCSDVQYAFYMQFLTPCLENGIGVNWLNLTNGELELSEFEQT